MTVHRTFTEQRRVMAYSQCWSCGDIKSKPAHRVTAARGILHWQCPGCQVSWEGPNQPALAPQARP